MSNEPVLQKTLSLPLVVFYGLGNILGAGIYVLIGEIAGITLYLTPLAFLVAATAASFTALSYCELSSRFPHSAGEAVYVQEGLGFKPLSIAVGFIVALAAINSAATISHGFVGYLSVFIQIPNAISLTTLIALLGFIAALRVQWALATASLLTLVEIMGLLLVIFSGTEALASFDYKLLVTIPPTLPVFAIISGVLSAAFLAFYAYLGFEDMVNMAEETRDAEKNLPRGIIIALLVATVFYIVVAIVALASVEPRLLGQSSAPLALVYETNTGSKPVLISIISLFAVVNGALIQIIMVSRLFFGMSKRGWIPSWLQQLHGKTQTPVNATILSSFLVVVFALWLPLETLARLSSFFILLLFALMNIALMRIKLKTPATTGMKIPFWVPVCGLLCAVLLIAFEIVNQLS